MFKVELKVIGKLLKFNFLIIHFLPKNQSFINNQGGKKEEDQLIAKYDLTKKKQLQSLLDEIAVGKLGNDDFSRKIRFSIEKMLGEKDIKPYTRTPDNTGQRPFTLEDSYTGAYDNLN